MAPASQPGCGGDHRPLRHFVLCTMPYATVPPRGTHSCAFGFLPCKRLAITSNLVFTLHHLSEFA
jgi:hypothetical protein